MVVTDLPLTMEDARDNDSPKTAQPITLPTGINGRLERVDDIDYYTFQAVQGDRFSFEVFAQQCNSEIDTEIRILESTARYGQTNDDSNRGVISLSDSRLENWTAPKSGKYFIQLSGLQNRGGPEGIYFLQVTRSKPYFELYLNTDKTQLTPGCNSVLFAKVVRKNGFNAEVKLQLDPAQLPAGVTASSGRILTGAASRHRNGWGTFSTEEDGCIILSASPDAKLSASNITVTGTAQYKEPDGTLRKLRVTAVPYQEIALGGSGRGYWPVDMHTVAVGKPNDIRDVKIRTTKLVLEPGTSKRIDITIRRAAGFTANVSLDMLYRHGNGTIYSDTLPEGVTIDKDKSKMMLLGEDSVGYITVTAAADAPPVKNQQVAVMANALMRRTHNWKTFCALPLQVSVTESSKDLAPADKR